MENNYAVAPNEIIEFQTRLSIGEVVIVDFCNIKLGYYEYYISVVKDIVIDKENNVYTCRLDNFNIDFQIFHQVPYSINSGAYIDIQNKKYFYIYKIEDFEKLIQIRHGFQHTKKSLLITLDYYKALVEAMKLKEKLQQEQK